MAFPSNDFMGQEPKSNPEIKTFCSKEFHVTFDLFAKIDVKGKKQAPLYGFLTKNPDEKIAGKVKWNFQKYVVDRHGRVIAKFGPTTAPEADDLVKVVTRALAEKTDG